VGSLSLEFNDPDARTIGEVVIENEKRGLFFDLELSGGYRYDTNRALHAPWWLPDSGTDAMITLANASDQNVIVSPSIVVQADERTSPALSLAPHETKKLSLRELLHQQGADTTAEGSVILRYTGPDHALFPALLLSNPETGFSLVSAFNAKHDQPTNEANQLAVPGCVHSGGCAVGLQSQR
jgi:hypothetical protein